jgi:hypothetical protein
VRNSAGTVSGALASSMTNTPERAQSAARSHITQATLIVLFTPMAAPTPNAGLKWPVAALQSLKGDNGSNDGQNYSPADIAYQLSCAKRDLERRCGGTIPVDENLVEFIPGHIARQLIEERDSKLAAQHEARRQARANQQANPVRQHVQATRAAQLGGEFSFGDDMSLSAQALARMTAADHEASMAASSRKMDEFLSGGATYHRITQDRERD